MDTPSHVTRLLSVYFAGGAGVCLLCLWFWLKLMDEVHYLYRSDQASDAYYLLRRLNRWVCAVFLIGLGLCLGGVVFNVFRTIGLWRQL